MKKEEKEQLAHYRNYVWPLCNCGQGEPHQRILSPEDTIKLDEKILKYFKQGLSMEKVKQMIKDSDKQNS